MCEYYYPPYRVSTGGALCPQRAPCPSRGVVVECGITGGEVGKGPCFRGGAMSAAKSLSVDVYYDYL
jgi:hypothetical protein